MHVEKKGLRALGIAESYTGRVHSTLAGVVMRKDMQIDGVGFSRITVGGMDATEQVEEIVSSLHREDINVLLLSGCVIGWYNMIDPGRVHGTTGLPVIVVTYEESMGLEEEIRRHFPGDEERIALYRRLGERTPVELSTGYTAWIRAWGLTLPIAERVCRDFTREGKIPEPLRVARLLARATHAFCLTATQPSAR